VFAPALTPDGWLAALPWSPPVRVIDTDTGAVVRTVPFGYYPAFSPDGRILAVAGQGPISLYDVATGADLAPPGRHVEDPHVIQFSRDGRRVLTVDRTGLAFVWDAATGGLVAGPPAVPFASSTTLSPDGTRGASSHGEVSERVGGPKAPHLSIWDVATGEVREFPWSCDPGVAVWAADGRAVFVVGKGGQVFAHPLRAGEPVRPLAKAGKPVWSLAASPDGRWLVAVIDLEVVVWDVSTGRVAGRTPLPDEFGECKWGHRVEGFSPDGRLAAVSAGVGVAAMPLPGGRPGVVFIRDDLTGYDTAGFAAGFTADGRLLAATSTGPEDDPYELGPFRVLVWDAATGRVLLETPELDYKVSALAFAPDGRRLAAASCDTTVLLWDLPRG
jgi:WD40 repeat protein